LALGAGADTITFDHLRASALAARVRLEIAREIRRGEEFFKATADAEAAARQLLDLEPAAKPKLPTISARAKCSVGERTPHRDAVGVAVEAT
jgi:hypothetical protein